MTLFNEMNYRFANIAHLIQERNDYRQRKIDAKYFYSIEPTAENDEEFNKYNGLENARNEQIKERVNELAGYLGFTPHATCGSTEAYISIFNTLRQQFQFAYEDLHFQATENNSHVKVASFSTYHINK